MAIVIRWEGGCLGRTHETCKASLSALAAVPTGTTPGESMPMHHKFAFWFPFHPPLSWVLCQLSFCINQREIFSPSCFFLFLNRLDVIMCSWACWGLGGGGTGGVMERRDGFRKNAYSPSEGENSLQLQVTSTSHTHWFTRETQSALIFKNRIESQEKRTRRERMLSLLMEQWDRHPGVVMEELNVRTPSQAAWHIGRAQVGI